MPTNTIPKLVLVLVGHTWYIDDEDQSFGSKKAERINRMKAVNTNLLISGYDRFDFGFGGRY